MPIGWPLGKWWGRSRLSCAGIVRRLLHALRFVGVKHDATGTLEQHVWLLAQPTTTVCSLISAATIAFGDAIVYIYIYMCAGLLGVK